MADSDTDRTRLRGLLVRHFDVEELRTLCDDLGIAHDDLGAEGRTAMARELIAYLERRGRLPELIGLCRERRPHVDWPQAGSPAEAERPAHDDPAIVARYLEAVRALCCYAEIRPYRQLSELRGAPPRLELLGEEGQAGIYVPLRFDLHLSRKAPPQSPPARRGEERPLRSAAGA